MNNNASFIDTMDNVNNVAKDYGFKNGIDWANAAKNKGEISYTDYSDYSNAHNLRVRIAHGGARDINVTAETLKIAKNFRSDVVNSQLRRGKQKINLPDGEFRYNKAFIKEFNWNGPDGENYYFKFKVVYEKNYLDDGRGGAEATGYFIHILDAPYFRYASERLHEFHIININSGESYHICWNKNITDFEEANAVMLVWLKRYVELISVIKNDAKISEKQLLARANKKYILPAGTFRKKNQQKSNFKKSRTGEKIQFYINEEVYNEIMNLLGKNKPELGGMLGWSISENLVEKFLFDNNARVSDDAYSPNTSFLNKVLEEWDDKGYYLAGFVHSHPGNYNRLSPYDVEYGLRIIDAFDMPYIFMPIVTSSYAYKTTITPYVIYPNGKVELCDLIIIKSENQPKAKTKDNEPSNDVVERINAEFEKMSNNHHRNLEININSEKPDSNYQGEDVVLRIKSGLDIEYLQSCTIIGIGCGGARGFYEDMARMGVGNFILMDGDKNEAVNIATQGVNVDEIGVYKPTSIKKKLLNVNPKINCKDINLMLTDELDDSWFENEVLNNIDRKKTIICAFTDDFFAQARINNLAIKYKLPLLAAVHHAFGLTSEAVFYYEGITPLKPQEVLSERYTNYYNGYKNKVTSEGSPIFNTTRLNSICEKIAIGLLEFNNNPESFFCSFLKEKSEHNYVLIRQQSLIETDSNFKEVFQNEIYDYFDDVKWLNPEHFFNIKKYNSGEIVDSRIIFYD